MPATPSTRASAPIDLSYRIGEARISASDVQFQAVLAHAYGGRPPVRPRCLCTPEGAEMYITRIGATFYLKRMPGQGSAHAWRCPSFEPPALLSGLGQVLGEAIQEDPADGVTALKLGFSLTRHGRRPPDPPSEAEDASATGSRARLSLRGLLHFLWEDAGFNAWSPAMAGKRNWAVIRKYLLASADKKRCRDGALTQWLYLPEVWDETQRVAIATRRRGLFLSIATARRATRKLLLLLGEVRLLEPGRYGHRLVVKHAPDVDFSIDDDLYASLRRRFATEISTWEAAADAPARPGHLIVLATFSVAASGRPALEEAILMWVTSNWIPVEDAFDAEVVGRLTADGRRFTRCLRYNLPRSAPTACAVSTDLHGPVVHYILRPDAEEHHARLEALIADSGLAAWVWRPAEGPPPPIGAEAGNALARAPASSATAFDPFAGH